MHFSHVVVFAGVVAAGYLPPVNTYTPVPTPHLPPTNATSTRHHPIIPTGSHHGHHSNGTATIHTPVNTPTGTGHHGGSTGTGSGSQPSSTSTQPSGVPGAAAVHNVQGSVAALLGLVAAGMIAL